MFLQEATLTPWGHTTISMISIRQTARIPSMPTTYFQFFSIDHIFSLVSHSSYGKRIKFLLYANAYLNPSKQLRKVTS